MKGGRLGSCTFLTVYFFSQGLLSISWQNETGHINLNSCVFFGGSSTHETFNASSTPLLSLPQASLMRPSGWIWPGVDFVYSASVVTAPPLAASSSLPSLQYVRAGGQRTWSDSTHLRQRLLPTATEKRPKSGIYVAGDKFLTRGVTPSQHGRNSSKLESVEDNDPHSSYNNQTGRPHVATWERFTAGRHFSARLEDGFSPATSEPSLGQSFSSSDYDTPNNISHLSIFRRRLQSGGAKEHATVQNRIPPELSVSQVWVQDSPQDYVQNASSADKYDTRTKEAVSQMWMPLLQMKGWLQARSLHISEEISFELKLLLDEYQKVDNLRRILEADSCVQTLMHTSNASSL